MDENKFETPVALGPGGEILMGARAIEAHLRGPAIAEDSYPELLRGLVLSIEELADGPPLFSKTAYTPRLTSHVAYRNGLPWGEGREDGYPPPQASVGEMAATLLRSAKAARAQIDGPAALVWRIEPTLEKTARGLELYARFCFEKL